MPEEKPGVIDINKVVAALERMAETPNTSAMTFRQQLREPRMLEAIRKARAAGYKTDDIAKLLNEQGLQIKSSTLTAYLREIEAESKGEGDTNGRSKPKASKGTTASKAATVKPETASETPSSSEGKKLTQKPNMGGAFGSDDL